MQSAATAQARYFASTSDGSTDAATAVGVAEATGAGLTVCAEDATPAPMALASSCGVGEGCDVAHAARATVENESVRAFERMRVLYNR